MNHIHQVIIWDWAERLAWALIGVIAYSFALAFTYNATEAETGATAKVACVQNSLIECVPCDKSNMSMP